MAPAAAARHAEIDRRYRWHAEEGRRLNGHRPKFNLAGRRITELNLFFTHRYGSATLPDDDSGRDDIAIMARHIACARRDDAARYFREWASARAPWMTEAEIMAVLARVSRRPLLDRADNLGRKLGLTETERRRLGIRTIGSVDMTAAKRKQARKLRGLQRDQARRRAAGAQPRAEYLEANSISATKPWEAQGISRASWYRRRARR